MKPSMPCLANAWVAAGCRHDIITTALCNATSSAGLPSTRESIYAELDPGKAEAEHARRIFIPSSSLGQARLLWKLLLPTLATPQVCPTAPITSKVQQQQQQSARTNAVHSSGIACEGAFFFLRAFALDSYGYLDTQAMDYIRHIDFAAASTGAVTYGSFGPSVHREVSVVLVKGSQGNFCAGVQLYMRVLGHARVPGDLVPTAEIE
jgi:hypothetical protein